MVLPPKPIHPKGELSELSKQLKPASIEIETFEGKVHIEWEPGASVTPMGQLPFFIQFLKTGCRFEPWIKFKWHFLQAALHGLAANYWLILIMAVSLE